MVKTKLTLGTKLELELYDANGDRIIPTLISQFEAVLPDNTMEVLSPILEGRIFPVHRGVQLDVIYEKNGDLIKFPAEALGRKLAGNIHILRIKPLAEEEKVQRRYFFRFDCIRDMDYRIFESQETQKEDRGDFKKGITRDISGGGVCLCASVRPDIGRLVEAVLHLDKDIQFTGQVVRVINVHDKGKFNYEIGIEFIDITNMNRERIISFIFNEQRKLLKKGWNK